MGRVGDSTFYELLEVSHGATPEEIEASYHRLVDVMAPDSLAMYAMLDDGEAERVRAQVEEAYRTLADPERRAEYDRAHPDDRPRSSYPDVMVPESTANTSMSVGRREDRAQEREPVREARDERPPEREERPAERDHAREARDDRPVERDHSRDDRDYSRDERASERYRDEPRAAAQAAPASAEGEQKSQPKPRPSARPQPTPARRGRLLQPAFGIEVTSDTECSGSLLRRLRESADADLEAVAEITKISKRYLHALEENDFDTLPAAVYVRGFVCEYARALGLDPKLVSKSYMSLYKRYRGEGG